MTSRTTAPTALITGASRGFGRAVARELADHGWILVVDGRDPQALAATADELRSQTRVIPVSGDVADPEHRAHLAVAVRRLGGLDAVINNASTLGPSPLPSLLDYPLSALEDVYRTNVIAPLALLQAVRSELRPGTRIVNITSDAAVEPYEGWGGYGSGKAALEQLSAVLAAENPQLRVFWLDPGDMRTAMHQAAFPGEDISDRPLPEERAPALLRLLEEDFPSGRYVATDLLVPAGVAR
ncbi:MAG TPA: SDR family oxidoreductase [Chloroflexota bacterium]|nr:SDR family oxidoreductase [Chloroflexota bacterium]